MSEYERGIISHLFGKANKLRSAARKKGPHLKAASTPPMLSQVGNLLRQAGIEYEKPAAILKRIVTQAKPINPSAAPSSSHAPGLIRRREHPTLPEDGSAVKLARKALRAALGRMK